MTERNLFVLCIILLASALKLEPIVRTESGTIIGRTLLVDSIAVNEYLGVPFAKPPVGPQRFKKPERVEPWKVPITANYMPPACIQYTSSPFPWRDDQPGMSEDCLYLNIWVPSAASWINQKAVMFWIYGGGFLLGSNRKPLYNGRILSSLGDVIVVTTNYRLGALGFLFSDSEDAPGNVGLYDILEALIWVNNNIEAFGGDTTRITVFGESAGSIAAGQLCVSPLSKNLFSRVIMESGAPTYLLADNTTQNLDLSQKLALDVGCANNEVNIETNPEEVVNCLRGVDALTLVEVENSFDPLSSTSFIPRFGDTLLPRNPRKAIIDGDFKSIEVMIGNNENEGAVMMTTSHPELFGFYGEKNTQINKTVGEMLLRKTFKSIKDPSAVVEYYLGNLQNEDYDEVRRQVCKAIGDYTLLCPDVYFAEEFAKKNNVLFYFFTHRPSNSPWAPWMGVVHFQEIQFVFGLPLRNLSQFPSNVYTEEEVLLSREMLNTWTSFAKFGKSSSDLMSWPLYSKESPLFKVLNTSSGSFIGRGPHHNNCAFFRPYFGF